MQQIYEQLSLEICQKPTAGVEGFLAKLFPLLENGEDLKICEELLSLKYSGLRQKESPKFFSLKTLQDYLTTRGGEHSEQFSVDFGNLGMMCSGRCLILKITECHKTGKGCSLSDILEDIVDEKYFLSQAATAKLLNNSSEEVKETESMTQGGVSCTLASQAGGKGAKTGLYLINKNHDEITFRDDFNCLDANYYKGLDAHQARTGVLEVRPVLTPDRSEKRQNGRRMKEPGEEMFTLTAQDKHGVLITEATKKGYAEAHEGDSINLAVPGSETRRVGVGVANTLDTSCNQGTLVQGRIRRLTPRECFRLQGFPDTYFNRAAAVNSDSQLYKQAGNSVSVPVIYEIARKLKD